MTRSHRLVLTAALGLLFAASSARAGGLRFVEVQRDGVNGVDGLNGAHGVAVSPDGRHLYAVGKLDDALAVFSRDNATGQLTFVESHKHTSIDDGLNGAHAVTVSPDGKHVYVASSVDDTLVAYSRDADTGALTFVQIRRDGIGRTNGLDGAEALALSPDGLFIYVAATNDDAVSVFSRDAATGRMTFVEFQRAGLNGVEGLLGARGVALSPDGSHVYVTGASEDAVALFRRDAVTGQLSYVEVVRDQVNGVDGLDKARGVAISADGANVYVVGGLADALSVFSRNPATGSLTFLEVMRDNTGGVNGLNAASAVAVSPDGTQVYVTGDVDDSMAVFGRDPATGLLTFLDRKHDGVGGVDGLNNASAVAVSPDSLTVYAAAFIDDAVSVFRVRLCGDGILDSGEQCDDGNTANGDCCSASCRVEAAGSACTDDANGCTNDACNAGGVCQHLANTNPCDDGLFCTEGDVCRAGSCQGTARDCTAGGDQCNAGVCDEAADACTTTPKADGTACNDGQLCTGPDVCAAGTCGGASIVCTAKDTCHDAGTCDPGTGLCSNPVKADGTTCDDGSACTHADSCQAGTCSGADPVVCTAADQCHDAGTCNPATGVCSDPAKADGAACTDGSACTRTDTCRAGACSGGNSVTCAPTDSCHDAGTCDPANGTCSNPVKADGAACTDGDACTRTDTCLSGACQGTNPIVCTAANQCHEAGACNHATGACSNPAKLNGSACDDGSTCTRTDTCQAGTCSGGDPVVCSAADQCHDAGVCDASSGTCSTATHADGTACNDGDAGTDGDVCTTGACHGSTIVDTDSDSIPDSRDLCPEVADPAQTDANHDGIGDACQCTAPAPGRCLPGGGPASADCIAELNPSGPVTFNRKHTAVMGLLRCTDGDAACDRDGTADGQCTFAVSVCLANGDPRLQCRQSDARGFEVLSPNPDKSRSSSDRANALALEQTIGSMGLEIRRGSRIVTALATPSGNNHCSPLVDLIVPAGKPGKASRRIFKLRTTATDGRSDIDRFTMECTR